MRLFNLVTGVVSLKRLAALTALTVFSAGANAIAITDVTFQIAPGPVLTADAAMLVGGNDSVSGVNALSGDFAGDPWALLDKTDDSSIPWGGVTFEVTATGVQSGTWGLSWSGVGLPVTLDLTVVTKAAGDWGAYLFEDITFSPVPSNGTGTFAISWLNRGGNIPGISHLSVYAREGDAPIDLPPEEPPSDVPVPATPLLLLLGITLLTRARRSA